MVRWRAGTLGRFRTFWVGGCIALAAALIAVPSSGTIRIPLVSPASQIGTRKLALGDWKLEIRRNKFSGDIACRLHSKDKRVFYVADALGFRFDKRLDVTRGWFRIDGGDAQRWRDQLPELARLGVAIDGRNLEAPTDGIVWIPAKRLADTNRIAIQPRPDKNPRIFHLRGFAGLRDMARTMGCAPEARFVR
jgi:hypothetical protein